MKKQCRRKVWARINPLAYVLEGIQPASGERLDKLRTLELSSLEAFRTGKAVVKDWEHLTNMMNIAENMAANGVGIEVLEVCQEAAGHLVEAARRYTSTRRMGLTGPALTCLRNLYEYHDLQRTSISLAEYERHIKDTKNRIASKAPEVLDALKVVCEA